jgi:hypothetical protein
MLVGRAAVLPSDQVSTARSPGRVREVPRNRMWQQRRSANRRLPTNKTRCQPGHRCHSRDSDNELCCRRPLTFPSIPATGYGSSSLYRAPLACLEAQDLRLLCPELLLGQDALLLELGQPLQLADLRVGQVDACGGCRRRSGCSGAQRLLAPEWPLPPPVRFVPARPVPRRPCGPLRPPRPLPPRLALRVAALLA